MKYHDLMIQEGKIEEVICLIQNGFLSLDDLSEKAFEILKVWVESKWFLDTSSNQNKLSRYHFVCFCVHFAIGSSFFCCGPKTYCFGACSVSHTVAYHYSTHCQIVNQNGWGCTQIKVFRIMGLSWVLYQNCSGSHHTMLVLWVRMGQNLPTVPKIGGGSTSFEPWDTVFRRNMVQKKSETVGADRHS